MFVNCGLGMNDNWDSHKLRFSQKSLLNSISYFSHTGRRKPRESLPDDDDEEDSTKMSMNCFSGNVKTLEVL